MGGRLLAGAQFNFWRCWESSGGISIGIAYGAAYFLVNRPMSEREQEAVRSQKALAGPSFEWLLVYSGLAAYLHVFLQSQFRPPLWGHLYFAVALLFGGCYYQLQRYRSVTSAEDANRDSRFQLDWGAAILVVAFIGGLFIDRREHALTAWGYPAIVGLLGFAWFWLRRSHDEAEQDAATPKTGDANLERIGLSFGLLLGLGLSVVNGLKGWFNVYLGNEDYWLGVLWMIFGPGYLLALIVLSAWTLYRPLPRDFRGDAIPYAYGAIWLVLIVQNVLAQLITGPPWIWNEVAFNIYYLLLFALSGVIVFHYHFRQLR